MQGGKQKCKKMGKLTLFDFSHSKVSQDFQQTDLLCI